MRVTIATPTTGGVVTAAYAQTLTAATLALTERGASYRLITVDGAEVAMARNILAHGFLGDAGATHVLFVDSDMAVDISVFRYFLKLDAPIVGAAYPERRMSLEDFHEAMAEEANLPRARALASNFTVRLSPGAHKVRRNCVEATGFGFGCVLIRREVFTAMIEREVVKPYVSAKLRAAGIEGEVWDFFSEIPLGSGDRPSEDFAFCRRVTELGDTPLLAYIGPGVGHVGQFTYGGPYVERLKAGRI